MRRVWPQDQGSPLLGTRYGEASLEVLKPMHTMGVAYSLPIFDGHLVTVPAKVSPIHPMDPDRVSNYSCQPNLGHNYNASHHT